MEDRSFRIAVFLSLVLHAGLFIRFYMDREELELFQKPTELNYQLDQPEAKPKSETEVEIHQIQDIAPKELQERMGVPQNISAKDLFFNGPGEMMDTFKMFERKPERLKGMKVTKEVSMPMLRSEKINTPSYVTYYQIVRDRIRDRAYTNYTKLSVGEIYLTFIISADGKLRALKIIEEKSTANDFLRAVGVKSVEEASPFPSFPVDLAYPELTFNVAISFQYRAE